MKPIKARRMWANAEHLLLDKILGSGHSTTMYYKKPCSDDNPTPVFALPTDKASVAQMCEQVAKALHAKSHSFSWEETGPGLKEFFREEATTALRSLGLEAK